MPISKKSTILSTILTCHLTNGETHNLQLMEEQELSTVLGGRTFVRKRVASGDYSVVFASEYINPQVKLRISPDVGNKAVFYKIAKSNDMISATVAVRAVTEEIGSVDGQAIVTNASIQNAHSLEWNHSAQDGLEIIIQGNKLIEAYLENLV